jgi:DNA-binding response OmpR family regulator
MQLPTVPGDGQSYRILVVEDDLVIGRLLMVNLKKAGFEAQYACNGQIGWRIFQEMDPHLVISDISMPEVDGHTLLRKIRTVSLVPIILMTAMDSEDWQMKSFKQGADDYVAKPFNVQLLMARIIANLRRVYKYQAPEEDPHFQSWPKCEGCGYMAPQVKFEVPGIHIDKVFACPVCKSKSLTFPVSM